MPKRTNWTIPSVLKAVKEQTVPEGECLVLPGWLSHRYGRPVVTSRVLGAELGLSGRSICFSVGRVMKYAAEGAPPKDQSFTVNTCGNRACVRLEHLAYSTSSRGPVKTIADVLRDVVRDARNVNGCLVLEGYPPVSAGYPSVNSAHAVKKLGSNTHTVSVARVVMYAQEGRPADGEVVRHLCGNKLCVLAEHLVYGTQRDNLQDMAVHGTGASKLSDEDEAMVRELVAGGLYQREVGKRFGVTRQTVGAIVRRERAKDKPRPPGTRLPFTPFGGEAPGTGR